MIIRRIKNYFRNKAWLLLKAKWKLRSGILVSVENDSDWFVFNEIFTNKEYDKAFDIFLPGLSGQVTVLDFGANVGYFTLRVADELQQAGISDYRIISVEASPVNYSVLRRRLDQGGFSGKVSTVSGLVGHKTGSDQVVSSEQHYGHSAAAVSGKESTQVSYVDVEELIGASTSQIDLLKCDIEGSEEIFLSAYPALLQKVNHAVFEFHADACDVDRCKKLLKEAGLFSKGIIKEDPAFKTSVEVFSRY